MHACMRICSIQPALHVELRFRHLQFVRTHTVAHCARRRAAIESGQSASVSNMIACIDSHRSTLSVFTSRCCGDDLDAAYNSDENVVVSGEQASRCLRERTTMWLMLLREFHVMYKSTNRYACAATVLVLCYSSVHVHLQCGFTFQ